MSEILGNIDINDYSLQKLESSGGGTVNLQSKDVTINQNGTTTVRPDTGYNGLSDVDVTVEGILDTSDATATEGDIALGKTAYSDGVKLTGTLDFTGFTDYDICLNLTKQILGSSEHAIAKYIQSSGTQLINTGYTPTNNTTVELTVSDVTSRGSTALYSANKTYNNDIFMIYILQGEMLNGYTSNFYAYNIITNDLVSKHTIKIFRRSIILDGTTINNDTTYINPNAINTTLHLFGFEGNRNNASFKLYNFKIYEDNVLVREFIPVLKNGKYCLYETITEQYFYNIGTGDFIGEL